MLGHGLSGTESARDRRRAALCEREQGVKDTLSCDQRFGCRIALYGRTRDADRPFLCHSDRFFRSVLCHDRDQCIIDRIFPVGDNGEDIALQIRRDHDFMGNGSRLRDLRDDGAAVDMIAALYGHVGLPFLFCIKGCYMNTAVNIIAAGFLDSG